MIRVKKSTFYVFCLFLCIGMFSVPIILLSDVNYDSSADITYPDRFEVPQYGPPEYLIPTDPISYYRIINELERVDREIYQIKVKQFLLQQEKEIKDLFDILKGKK